MVLAGWNVFDQQRRHCLLGRARGCGSKKALHQRIAASNLEFAGHAYQVILRIVHYFIKGLLRIFSSARHSMMSLMTATPVPADLVRKNASFI